MRKCKKTKLVNYMNMQSEKRNTELAKDEKIKPANIMIENWEKMKKAKTSSHRRIM